MWRYGLCVLGLVLLWPGQGWGAVAFGTIGGANGGTTSISVAYPASIAVGDLLVLCVNNKYPTNGPSTPTGFTAPSNNRGTGDPGDGPGADVGATYSTVYYRVADATESGSLSITITSGNASYGVMSRYTNATGSWSVAAASGGDATSGTSWSATMGTDPEVLGGDMVFACSGINSNTIGASAQAISTAGVTYGAATQRFDNATSAGDHVGIVISDHAVTSGTSSAAPVYTFTYGSNTAGGTAILRMRESAAGGGCHGAMTMLGVGRC